MLGQISTIMSSGQASAKDVAAAAYALAGLNSRSDRRLWGKVFEAAAAVKGAWDPSSLSAFMWAITAAKVDHFRTVSELAGPAAAHLQSFSPSQLSYVAEALGAARVGDVELWGAVAARVAAGVADFSSADLARVLWGYAAAGQQGGPLVAAATKALAGAADVSAKELGQVLWALATLRRADKPLLDAATRALGSKAGGAASADVAAALWGLASLGHGVDAGTLRKAAAAVGAGAAQLSPSQAIQAAWALASLGADKEAAAPLLAAAAKQVAAAPDALQPADIAALYEAATISGAAVPPQVLAYCRTIYGVVAEHKQLRQPSDVQAFVASLKEATAKALGARYKPTIVRTVTGFAQSAPGGIPLQLCINLDAGTQVVLEAVPSSETTSAGAPSGSALARQKVLQAAGYKVALVSQPSWAALADDKAQAAAVAKALDAAMPGAAKKAAALIKEAA